MRLPGYSIPLELLDEIVWCLWARNRDGRSMMEEELMNSPFREGQRVVAC